jgi:hypothetical protein
MNFEGMLWADEPMTSFLNPFKADCETLVQFAALKYNVSSFGHDPKALTPIFVTFVPIVTLIKPEP